MLQVHSGQRCACSNLKLMQKMAMPEDRDDRGLVVIDSRAKTSNKIHLFNLDDCERRKGATSIYTIESHVQEI